MMCESRMTSTNIQHYVYDPDNNLGFRELLLCCVYMQEDNEIKDRCELMNCTILLKMAQYTKKICVTCLW
jgi:hypothetical protein